MTDTIYDLNKMFKLEGYGEYFCPFPHRRCVRCPFYKKYIIFFSIIIIKNRCKLPKMMYDKDELKELTKTFD